MAASSVQHFVYSFKVWFSTLTLASILLTGYLFFLDLGEGIR